MKSISCLFTLSSLFLLAIALSVHSKNNQFGLTYSFNEKNTFFSYGYNSHGGSAGFDVSFGINNDALFGEFSVQHYDSCVPNTLFETPCEFFTLDSFIFNISSLGQQIKMYENSTMFFSLDFGKILNVDPEHIHVSITAMDGTPIPSKSEIPTSFIMYSVEFSDFLSKGISVVKLSIVSQNEPLPKYVNIGEKVQVSYKRSNVYLTDRRNVTFTFDPFKAFEYTLTTPQYNEDYYSNFCNDGVIYSLVDFLEWKSNNDYSATGLIETVYSLNQVEKDYYGNDVKLNLKSMDLYLNGASLTGSKAVFQPPSTIITKLLPFATTRYRVMAPYLNYTQKIVPTGSKTIQTGIVSKGQVSSFIVPITVLESDSSLYFSYQLTNQASAKAFISQNKNDDSIICGSRDFLTTISYIAFSEKPIEKLISPRKSVSLDGTYYFNIFFGCVSDTPCQFQFQMIEKNKHDDKPEDPFDYLLVLIPSISLALFLMPLAVVLGVLVFVYYRKKKLNAGAQQPLLSE